MQAGMHSCVGLRLRCVLRPVAAAAVGSLSLQRWLGHFCSVLWQQQPQIVSLQRWCRPYGPAIACATDAELAKVCLCTPYAAVEALSDYDPLLLLGLLLHLLLLVPAQLTSSHACKAKQYTVCGSMSAGHHSVRLVCQ
jgi:hypothetical protein